MKKVLSLLLVLCLMASVLVACGGSDKQKDPGSTTTTNSNEASVSSDKPQKVSITIMGGPKKPDSWLEKKVEDALKAKGVNVDLELVALPDWGEHHTKVNLMMADPKTMPDVVWHYSMSKDLKQWSDAGLVVDVLPLLKNTKNKNILKEMKKETLFKAYDNGKMYQIPSDVGDQKYSCMIQYMRKDWLDNLGLKVPTTLDEYLNVLRAFTNNDPDKNGKKDTYGMFAQCSNPGDYDWRMFSQVFYSQKVEPTGFNKKDDGTIAMGFTFPQTKKALEILRDLYKEGVIDPNSFNKNEFGELLNKGKAGSFYNYHFVLNPYHANVKAFKQNNPGAELIGIDPIKGPDGFSADYPEPPGGWCFLSVTKAAKDPQFVVNVLDEMFSNDINMIMNHGEESKTYVLEDGQKKDLGTGDERDALGMGNFSWILTKETLPPTKPEVEASNRTTVSSKRLWEVWYYPKYGSQNMPVYRKYASDIKDLINATFVGIITGQKDISEFEKMIETYYNKYEGKVIDQEATAEFQKDQKELEQFDAIYNSELKVK